MAKIFLENSSRNPSFWSIPVFFIGKTGLSLFSYCITLKESWISRKCSEKWTDFHLSACLNPIRNIINTIKNGCWNGPEIALTRMKIQKFPGASPLNPVGVLAAHIKPPAVRNLPYGLVSLAALTFKIGPRKCLMAQGLAEMKTAAAFRYDMLRSKSR